VLVKDRMTPQPLVVVTPDTPIIEAQQQMQEHDIRHLPVVSEHNKLEGLLTRETILQAIPWSAASLSVLETQYILSKIKVGKVMLREVLTTNENVAVEEAARIMVDNKTSCLPVLRQLTLVGIITDIDLLSTTIEMLGARRKGCRLSVLVPNRVGQIARLTTAIAEIGGNLAAVGTWKGIPPEPLGVVLKVDKISREQLVAVVEGLEEIKILDVRET
jgi:acetoin utilization protein AcuB